ncbi:ATP-binding protein [Microcoleus sp. A006_D1]|uniref:ATP-binding protein n=1 Tax=Microcoleus sp. A006_D1 TaxID=3055267 RepID=UPI002FD039DE
MPQYPEISYARILSELSVNRKDPCEVIRELISNSYDASASRIEIYPLVQSQYKGFIYFDNGTGLSEEEEINEITPYRAFFSIGKSTKIQGESIGYKCQGSKLCFASQQITLITRCKNEENWRSISIDNPKHKLNQEYDIQSQTDCSPWETLKKIFIHNNKTTTNILEKFNQDFFVNQFSTGAMIVVHKLEVENFSEFYDAEEDGTTKWSYLKHYIRFNTKHGDMRILRPDETDFPDAQSVSFKKSLGYNEDCELYLCTTNKLEKLKAGYPYLGKPDEQDKLQIKSPAKIARLNDGRFFGRGAATFRFQDTTYCLTLAIDGNRRALDKHEELDRKGKKKSGIRLTDQRGTFICSDGVKICEYNELFEHSKLQDYAVLGTASGQLHYIFMINGTFDVVTNRNSLTDTSLSILKDDSFIDNIKQFFDKAKSRINAFIELIDRLNKEDRDLKLEAYTKKLIELKEGIQDRTRFTVRDIDQLKEKILVEPGVGEEHWVGALYTMFAHFVPQESQYADIWLRPLTFSGMGIDSVAVSIGEKTLATKIQKALEYKYTLSPSDEFNHPLKLTDQIVCWEMTIPKEGEDISDSYEHFGKVSLTEELKEIGYKIIKIQSRDGEWHDGEVKVISLKNLINKTFDCEWVTPPPKATNSNKRKGSKKSK